MSNERSGRSELVLYNADGAEACPWCTNFSPPVFVVGGDYGVPCVAVACPTCGSRGPRRAGAYGGDLDGAKANAVRSWNTVVAAANRAAEDTKRINWVDGRRVVIARCREPVHNDAWKVDTIRGPYIRDALREAIDLAIAMSGQPRKDEGDER